MQHHGGPTRLLDFTRSHHVALFFALEMPNVDDARRVVWAVNTLALQLNVARQIAAAGGGSVTAAYRRLRDDQLTVVADMVTKGLVFDGAIPVEPWFLGARQAIQQSIHLCQGNVSVPFEECLASLPTEPTVVVRIELTNNCRAEGLTALGRMSMTAEHLFPDVDGLARSLRTRELPTDIDPIAFLLELDTHEAWQKAGLVQLKPTDLSILEKDE